LGHFFHDVDRRNILFTLVAQVFVEAFELVETLSIFGFNVEQFPEFFFVFIKQASFEVFLDQAQKPAVIFIGYSK
jgi:hypothetical protein